MSAFLSRTNYQSNGGEAKREYENGDVDEIILNNNDDMSPLPTAPTATNTATNTTATNNTTDTNNNTATNVELLEHKSSSISSSAALLEKKQLQEEPIPVLMDYSYGLDPVVDNNNNNNTGKVQQQQQRSGSGDDTTIPNSLYPTARKCINPAAEINSSLDKHVEVRVYPCNSSSNQNKNGGEKKYKTYTIKPEGAIIQGTINDAIDDLGTEYGRHVGRKLQRIELLDTRANQLLVTSHNSKSFFVVPSPEAFSRHAGTCRLLGDRKHSSASHSLKVGDFLRIGSVGIVVIETHDGIENRILSEEKIKQIVKDTEATNNALEADGDTEHSDDEEIDDDNSIAKKMIEEVTDIDDVADGNEDDNSSNAGPPVCYMCFDEEDTEENPMITPCQCKGDTKHVHVECLRKWHTSETDDNQICFRSSVDATCSVCKSTFDADFKLQHKYGEKRVKLFQSTLQPPYVSFLVATKHEMAKGLFNTRFQLSFSTVLKTCSATGEPKPTSTRSLCIGRSSGSDMILDYRTVSAHHASIKFKNGEFLFSDAGSSNGSYLYLRKPMELSSSSSQQPLRFRLGRSMITMKVVNTKKLWNRRLFRAVRGRSTSNQSTENLPATNDYEEQLLSSIPNKDDRHSIGSNATQDDICITDGKTGLITKTIKYRTRESVINELPPHGQLSQHSIKHLDLLYALAYQKQHPQVKSKCKILES